MLNCPTVGFLSVTLLVIGLTTTSFALDEKPSVYPTKSIELDVSYGAGTGSDLTARSIALVVTGQ